MSSVRTQLHAPNTPPSYVAGSRPSAGMIPQKPECTRSAFIGIAVMIVGTPSVVPSCNLVLRPYAFGPFHKRGRANLSPNSLDLTTHRILKHGRPIAAKEISSRNCSQASKSLWRFFLSTGTPINPNTKHVLVGSRSRLASISREPLLDDMQRYSHTRVVEDERLYIANYSPTALVGLARGPAGGARTVGAWRPRHDP